MHVCGSVVVQLKTCLKKYENPKILYHQQLKAAGSSATFVVLACGFMSLAFIATISNGDPTTYCRPIRETLVEEHVSNFLHQFLTFLFLKICPNLTSSILQKLEHRSLKILHLNLNQLMIQVWFYFSTIGIPLYLRAK